MYAQGHLDAGPPNPPMSPKSWPAPSEMAPHASFTFYLTSWRWVRSQVTCFWWEIAEMLRKFLLVGLFVTIEPGSITQIALATIVTAVFLLVQLQAKPYKSASDDFLASASSFALLMIFFCSVIYKYVELTDTQDISNKMSIEQQEVCCAVSWSSPYPCAPYGRSTCMQCIWCRTTAFRRCCCH